MLVGNFKVASPETRAVPTSWSLLNLDKTQVPLHLLCDDLLLCQEATGNMYKLQRKST